MKTAKRILAAVVCLTLTLSITSTALAYYEPDIDYMANMIEAATTGNMEAGYAAELSRNEKIIELHLEEYYPMIAFDDLYLVSKIVQAEAGSSWLTDEHQQLVASVLYNRKNGPEFCDTYLECIHQPGQYYPRGSTYFANLLPSERAVRNALYVLENGSIAPPSVVFQSEFSRNGSGIWKSITDSRLGTTYFNYTNYPRLYE